MMPPMQLLLFKTFISRSWPDDRMTDEETSLLVAAYRMSRGLAPTSTDPLAIDEGHSSKLGKMLRFVSYAMLQLL